MEIILSHLPFWIKKEQVDELHEPAHFLQILAY